MKIVVSVVFPILAIGTFLNPDNDFWTSVAIISFAFPVAFLNWYWFYKDLWREENKKDHDRDQ